MQTRRILSAGGMFAFIAWAGHRWLVGAPRAAEAPPITHDDADWHKLLTPDQYAVLRQAATERPFTSPPLHEERKGIFTCAGCAHDLFSSTTTFDSHTGWLSFWTSLDKAVETDRDISFGMIRTAVQYARCGGHLGHVFDDGPQPTGPRYCMNGVAMGFKPESA